MQTVAQNTIFAVVTVTTYPTISTSVALAMNLCGGRFILRLTDSSACRAGDRQTAGLKFTPHRRGVAGGWLRPWVHPDKLTEAPMQNWLKICSYLITWIHCTLLLFFLTRCPNWDAQPFGKASNFSYGSAAQGRAVVPSWRALPGSLPSQSAPGCVYRGEQAAVTQTFFLPWYEDLRCYFRHLLQCSTFLFPNAS